MAWDERVFEELAHDRLARRRQVSPVPLLFGAPYGGLCAFEESPTKRSLGRGVGTSDCSTTSRAANGPLRANEFILNPYKGSDFV